MSEHQYVRDGDEIYRRSFEIIRSEADLSGFSSEEEDVVVRMIHASGSVGLAQYVDFAPGFVAAASSALAKGAPILCDAHMVVHGITQKRLAAGNEIICTLRDSRTLALAMQTGNTRSASALEFWRDRLDGAVVAIGNAPTALFHLLNMLQDGAPKPAAIIGMPVGFVGAQESKEALREANINVPWGVVRGRLGGSAITAATLNALARAGI